MELDLVVIGNLLIDEFENGETRAGGAAFYTALAAKAAGLKVGVHSVVGTDFPVSLLTDRGIETSLVKLDEPNGRAIIQYREHGRILVHKGPGHEVMTPQTPQPFRTKLVHLAPMPRSWQLFHLKDASIGSAFLDPYPTFTPDYLQELTPLLQHLRYLLLNEEELDCEIGDLPEELPVLLKQGEKGGVCLPQQIRWEARPTEVVDLTGAGDSFVAGLAAGLVRGLSTSESLEMGAKLAARVIGRPGAEAFLF